MADVLGDNDEDNDAYISFKGRQAKGILYRIDPMPTELLKRMKSYVEDGYMQKDMRYARGVYGLVNTSGRKDFEHFWESAWNEENIQNAPKKRRMEAQQRAMAVRSYIRASAPQESENVEKYLNTVDQLTKWEDQHDAKDAVKTVSRMVQSFERTAIRSMATLVGTTTYNRYKDSVFNALNLGNEGAGVDAAEDEDADGSRTMSVVSSRIEKNACAIRRDDRFFDLFAALVAAEIILADATNGSRVVPQHLCQRLVDKKTEATLNMVRTIYSYNQRFIDDDIGMPLMEINGSMCVARGLLVVCPGNQSATYVLDIQGDAAADLSNVRTITVTKFVKDNDDNHNADGGII